MSNPCTCDLCNRSRQFRGELEKLPEVDREFWTNLYNHLCNVEADRDYYKVVVDGSWPSADEVIANHRKKKNEPT